MTRQHQKIVIKVGAFSIIALLCGLTLIAFWFRLALRQPELVGETSIVLAAAKMELAGEDVVPLGPNLWLKRAYKNGIFQQNGDALDKLLAGHGWKHTDQEGSARILYQKQEYVMG